MTYHLKEIKLFLSDPYVLVPCIPMIERCNGMGLKIGIYTSDEFKEQRTLYKGQVLYISDDVACVKDLLDKELATIAYLHERNRNVSFPNCRYAMENPEDIDAEYFERIYRRYADIPWDILQTERCVIRETTVADVDSFWEMYKAPAITTYTEGLYPTLDEERAYIRDYIDKAYHFYEYGVWTVLLKGTDEIIGRAGLSLRDGYEIPELGYVIGCDYQRRGYAYEVCKGILKYAAEYLGLEQVGALVHKDNQASVALLKKLGFSYSKNHDDTMDYYVGQTSTTNIN